jgi:hypothetical protein
MLKCSKCQLEKDESEFHRNKRYKNGYSYVCNSCKKEYQADWYKRHHSEQYARINNTKQKIADYVKYLKETTPCADCGNFYPYYVMDFDHVRGNKKFNLAHAKLHGFNKVKLELEKCEIVCANCHRIRTYSKQLTS